MAKIEKQSDFYEPVKNAVLKAIEDIEKQFRAAEVSPEDHVITGIKNLNFHRGDLIVLGSRPSVGKTSFSLSLSNHLATEQNIPVGYISGGSMDYGKIGQRLISMESGISYRKITQGLMNIDEFRKMQEAASRIYDAPLYYHNKPNIMLDELELTARMMVEEAKVQLIIVDSFEYLQEVVDAKEDEFRSDLEDLMDHFRKMAKDLNVPVILLMDMPFSEGGSEPSLCEFKKYMIIPHKADMVLFLHRVRCVDEENVPDCKVIVAKNTEGACCDVDIRFCFKTLSFEFS